MGGALGEHLKWAVFGGVHVSKRENDEDDAPLSSRFPASQTAGLEQQILAGEFGAALKVNTRDKKGVPGKGTHAGVSISRFQGSDGFRYVRTKANLSQFFTLFKSGRIFGLGGRFETVDTPGGGAVPFSDFPTLGGTSKLRGFKSLRFRDETMVLGGGGIQISHLGLRRWHVVL